MFFWQKVDLDWKSCVQRRREKERKRDKRKRISRSIFSRNPLWGAVCLALAIFIFDETDYGTAQYVIPAGLLLFFWLAGAPVRSRLFFGGVILAVTFWAVLHGLATHADYVVYSLLGVPVAGLVMGVKSEIDEEDDWDPAMWGMMGIAGVDKNPLTSGVDDWD